MYIQKYSKSDIKKSKLPGVEDIITAKKNKINNELNRFSKLSRIIEQKEEFVKTPTKKIKRFLYENKKDSK